jgi:V8-like Glu-specific endopeptidase
MRLLPVSRVISFSLFFLLAAGLLAQTSYIVITNKQSDEEIRGFWTPERIADAKPAPMPSPELPFVPEAGTEGAAPSGPHVTTPGRPPSVLIPPSSEQVAPVQEQAAGAGPVPAAKGTSGLYYTSTRLIPVNAVTQYPYVTAGKLLYTKPGQAGGFSCTASMISYRLLLTAGHCLNDGNGTFFQNFMFIPAFNNGTGPYGTWTWNTVFITQTWADGGGTVPNAADYGILVLNDRALIGEPVRRLGDYVGFLGTATLSLAPNDLVILGYPCNLDNANMMHQVFSGQSSVPFFGNIARYGDDMEQGSSGGPWIQDFGVPAAGQIGGGLNQVVGVASFTDDALPPGGGCITAPAIRTLGASIFDNRFTTVYNAACANAPGNCS